MNNQNVLILLLADGLKLILMAVLYFYGTSIVREKSPSGKQQLLLFIKGIIVCALASLALGNYREYSYIKPLTIELFVLTSIACLCGILSKLAKMERRKA